MIPAQFLVAAFAFGFAIGAILVIFNSVPQFRVKPHCRECKDWRKMVADTEANLKALKKRDVP